MAPQAPYMLPQALHGPPIERPKVVTMQVSGAAMARNGRATTSALIGASMFGPVPHPVASLGPYRQSNARSLRWGRTIGLPVRTIREMTSREHIAQPRDKLESAGVGGGVQ